MEKLTQEVPMNRMGVNERFNTIWPHSPPFTSIRNYHLHTVVAATGAMLG